MVGDLCQGCDLQVHAASIELLKFVPREVVLSKVFHEVLVVYMEGWDCP